MSRGPDARPERQEALRRFFALPLEEQLAAFAEIKEYLDEEVGAESDLDRAVRAKHRALEALEAAQAHLAKSGQAADGAPLKKQMYEEAASELGLTVSSSRIIRVFGTWRSAQQALLGDVPESVAQRRLRLRAAGRQRSHEADSNHCRTTRTDLIQAIRRKERVAMRTGQKGLTQTDEERVWEVRREGLNEKAIARRLGLSQPWVKRYLTACGGIRPPRPARRAEHCLRLADREEISRGIARGDSARRIARRLGRRCALQASPSHR